MRYPRERTIFLDILRLNSTSGNVSGKGETFCGTKGETVRETVRIAATRNSDGSWEMLRTREITRQGIAVGAEVISGLRKTFNSFLIAYWPYKYLDTSYPIVGSSSPRSDATFFSSRPPLCVHLCPEET